MKREIKLRAWLKAESKMCTISVINFDCGAFLVGAEPGADRIVNNMLVKVPQDGRFCYFGEFEMLEFTGLKDKNGEEIYEGDILVYVPEQLRKPIPFVMTWENDRAEWTKFHPKDKFEIIGNIFKNPELL